MKGKNRICIFAILMLAAMIFSACGQAAPTPTESVSAADSNTSETSSQAPTAEPYVIKFPSAQVGVNASAPLLAEGIKRFEEKYAGVYKVEIEEIPGDQAYVDKMKVLLSVDQLPDVVYAGGYNLLDSALEKDVVVDLTPYLDQDPDWKAGFSEAALDFNSRNGKVYSIPPQTDMIGYFYNKEMFDKVGVQPAKTWDEFFAVCDKLLAAGITPLSMDTSDSGWVTSLWLMSMVGTADAQGLEFANTPFPKEYNTPEFVSATEKIQTMFQKYTTTDAIGGGYEPAANNFLSEQTAMCANGLWMISDFTDEAKAAPGFIDKVGVAVYPGGGMFDAANLGYFVAAKTPEGQQAGIDFIKFMTGPEMGYVGLDMIGTIPANLNVEIDDAIKAKYPLLAEFLEVSKTATARYNYHQSLWYPNALDAITTLYPSLAMGEISPEEFAQKLTDIAAKN